VKVKQLDKGIIGVMSGTSLDGVDVACCKFIEENNRIQFLILACETYPYPEMWQTKLRNLPSSTAVDYAETHVKYGKYLGDLVQKFVEKHDLEPALVASHGHTIFHNPEAGFTSQIGDGASLSYASRLPVVCDFRSNDVAAGGQGAPLVPVGDMLLFADYEYCLNLGGFANISFASSSQRLAYDIAPANILLNHLAGQLGKEFDRNGEMAAKGFVNHELLNKLNSLDFYHLPGPKSLGREWLETKVLPLIENNQVSLYDKLATCNEHIAIQIAQNINNNSKEKVLVTGGGAFNANLIETIRRKTKATIIIPDPMLINYKEALIFAFLGWLRINERANSLSSVTGARFNSIGGALYLPPEINNEQ
jgi:anhydro-N-acetylmuramic acid kinase